MRPTSELVSSVSNIGGLGSPVSSRCKVLPYLRNQSIEPANLPQPVDKPFSVNLFILEKLGNQRIISENGGVD